MGKFKVEAPKNIWVDEIVCLRSKKCSFKCGEDNKNKIKGVSNSYSKNFKFEEYKKSLNGEKNQEKCEISILGSVNHEMYLQKMKKIFIIYFR